MCSTSNIIIILFWATRCSGEDQILRQRHYVHNNFSTTQKEANVAKSKINLRRRNMHQTKNLGGLRAAKMASHMLKSEKPYQQISFCFLPQDLQRFPEGLAE